MANATLSSALSVFTSEFEMESGGSHLLLPPGKSCVARPEQTVRFGGISLRTIESHGATYSYNLNSLKRYVDFLNTHVYLINAFQIIWVLYGQVSRFISTG